MKEFSIKTPKSEIYIKFLPSDRVVPMSHPEESVLEAAERVKISIFNTCGGNGTCGTCRVRVLSDLSALPERNEIEAEFAMDRSFSEDERLACQLIPSKSITIEILTTD